MSPAARRAWLTPVLIAGVAYPLIGVATAALSGAAPTSQLRTTWRLAAWLLSLLVFALHLAWERGRLHRPARPAAAHVALGVALGALLLAAAGPVRSHWGAPDFQRSALLSLPLWPILLGVPAYLAALVAGVLLDRRRAAPTVAVAAGHPAPQVGARFQRIHPEVPMRRPLAIAAALCCAFFVFYEARLLVVTRFLTQLRPGGGGAKMGAVVFPVLALLFGWAAVRLWRGARADVTPVTRAP